MTKPDRSTLRACAVAAVILAAVICRRIGIATPLGLQMGLLRAALYIGLYIAWGFSIRSRIIQTQARRYLLSIVALMVFWFVARTLKYHAVFDDSTMYIYRYLWYLYYLPMLLIPLFSVFVSVSLGKPEDYRLPKWANLLAVPTAALSALVLTNDLHQMVFVFRVGAEWVYDNSRHGVVYYLIAAWLLFCALLMLGILTKKCRIPAVRKRVWIPIAFVCALVGYTVLYDLGVDWLFDIAGDMTAAHCLLYAAVLESCIQCGLIRGNTHYRDMFDISTVGAQILDDDYRVFLASQASEPHPAELLRRTEDGPVMLGEGLRLCGKPIHGGHIVWEENVAESYRMMEALRTAREQLEGESELLTAEKRAKEEKASSETKNLIYGRISKEMAPQLARMAELLGQEGCDGKKRLGELCVLGAYVKRRSNLILQSEEKEQIPAQELAYCLRESVSNLEAVGVDCSLISRCAGTLPARSVLPVYDFFEAVIEQALPSLTSALLHLDAGGEAVALRMMLSCGEQGLSLSDLPPCREILAQGGQCRLTESDGEWQILVSLPEGGDAP